MFNRTDLASRVELDRHRTSTTDADWTDVSSHYPCAVCGAHSNCSRRVDDVFVSCTRHPSDWPLTTGGWLHRLTLGAVPAADAAIPYRR